MERMPEERIVKRIYKSGVEGVRPRGRPRMRWFDGVEDILTEDGREINAARERAINE
jgi:hypothetical protein